MAKKPKLDLNEGEEVQVKLTHSQPVSGKNGYGEYHMYGVEKPNGEECVFFAPPEVHQIISERKLSKGSQFALRKVNGKLGIVLTGNHEPHREERGQGDGYRELMEKSLMDAIEATRLVNTVQWSVEDIKSIGLTIFIQRART